MKRNLVLSLVLNTILLSLWLSREAWFERAGAASNPAGNGDVNGDGAYNLSDAVYLLNWLFQGGPAPLAIAAPPGDLVHELPATGQSECFDSRGATVPCPSPSCPGQDGQYQAGCPREGRFVDRGDGTVFDACTGLEWQKETADLNADGEINGSDLTTWCEGMAYCEGLSLAGHDDWRLPNVFELVSIVDYGTFQPASDPIFQVAPINPCYLCSTALRGGPGPGHFLVDFGLGLVGGGGGVACYVRAVRGPVAP